MKIVVVTNGDFPGVQTGLARQVESVNAAQVLGLTEQNVIFLGYPDGALMQIYNAPSPTDVITSNAGQTQTYGNRGHGQHGLPPLSASAAPARTTASRWSRTSAR